MIIFRGSSIRQKRRGDDYYIQESKIPTLHFQASLPRLPVPELADSCNRYLSAVQPLLSESEFQTTQQLAKDFSKEGSDGSGKPNIILIIIRYLQLFCLHRGLHVHVHPQKFFIIIYYYYYYYYCFFVKRTSEEIN